MTVDDAAPQEPTHPILGGRLAATLVHANTQSLSDNISPVDTQEMQHEKTSARQRMTHASSSEVYATTPVERLLLGRGAFHVESSIRADVALDQAQRTVTQQKALEHPDQNTRTTTGMEVAIESETHTAPVMALETVPPRRLQR